MYIAGFDVHLDGKFTDEIKAELKSKGWIILDYISSDGAPETTVTKHFTDEAGCKEEYDAICAYMATQAGFSGHIYYERPLGFQVFGETEKRPIICTL